MSTAILPNVCPSSQPVALLRASPFVRLHVAAKVCGVSTSTLRRLCNSGLVECRRTPVGHHRTVDLREVCEVVGVVPPEVENTDEQETTGRLIVGYCRVSTANQRTAGSLDRQRERVEEYIRANYPAEKSVVLYEQASGTNSDRKKLGRLLDMVLAGRVSKVAVEWPDRLSRGSYGIISRLLEKCGVEIVVTRTGEKENDAKTQEEEVLHDALCAIYCVQAKAHGRRASIKQTLIPPAGFKERVCQLAGAGLSRVDILKQIAADKPVWTCQSTGRPLGVRSVRLVLESLPPTQTIPASVRTFIKRRCVVGAGKRERSAVLYDAYVAHCEEAGCKPLNRDRWMELVKRAVPHARLENDRFTTVYGLALKAARP